MCFLNIVRQQHKMKPHIVPFTLYEAIAAYLYDCWGEFHDVASEVPIKHAGNQALGKFCRETCIKHKTKNLCWLSASYENTFQSSSLQTISCMCEQVLRDLADGSPYEDLVLDLCAEIQELM